MKKKLITACLAMVTAIGTGMAVHAQTIAITGEDGVVHLCQEVGIQEETAENPQNEMEDIMIEIAEQSQNGSKQDTQEASAAETAEDSYESALTEKKYQEYLEAERKKEEEYKKAGITTNRQGEYFFEGEKVYFLLDDAGGMYQNGDAKENKIYLYVERKEDGTIRKVEKVSGKQIVEKIAEKDEKKD